MGNSVEPLKGKKASDFIKSTEGWLNAIKKTATGAKLLAAIDATGRTIDIYRTWDITDGNYQGGGDDDKAMVTPLTTKYTDGTTELQDVLAAACGDISGRSKIKKFFNIGKPRHRFLSLDAFSRLIGISSKDLKEMAAGKKAIPKVVDDKLRVYLYDFLTPGDGDNCYVVFNHKRDNLSDKHKRYLPMSHNWEHRPPGIALAHELIHAWRVAAGMVLFEYGWEEEAMTVGLPPFSNMQFTENRVRVEWGGLAVRPDYKHIEIESELIKGTPKIGIDKQGDRSWQGKQSALHTNQTMAQQASARRKAMGYDDDEDGDDGW